MKLDEVVVAGGDKAVVFGPKVVVMVPFEPYKVLVPLVLEVLPYMVLEVLLFWEVP